ncbi:MAG: beta-ketoacyl-[acyl-carrier-protein] synthase family protein [Planctomycetes bacterium]|nr:beta-ketoacyl-[acyl-carrier-protein] synthase family protein [Planctomycetota bacterium]
MSSDRSTRRVVITGLGLVSPLGNTPDALWEALTTGRSGVIALAQNPVTPVSRFGSEAHPWNGEIDDFGPLEGEKKKAIRKGLKVMCRESQMGVAAAQRALHDAGLGTCGHVPERTGVVFGSDYMLSPPEELQAGIMSCVDPERKFHFEQWGGHGMTQMQPLWLLKFLPNMPAAHITFYNDFRGPSNSLTQREASSNLAIGEAFRVIQRGHADIMIAGATGTRLHVMKAVHALQTEPVAEFNPDAPEKASRPFDRDRTGTVLGEGAGSVILESLESARARGAKIYGEVLGAGAASVATRRLIADRRQAFVNALRMALRDAGLKPEQIGHLQAHGLGTISCDQDEAAAIKEVFGAYAKQLPVTAVKSYSGNIGAASGMVEMIAGLLALDKQKLFPVLNLAHPDPEIALNLVRNGAAQPGDTFVNQSVTPQGQAATLVIARWRE